MTQPESNNINITWDNIINSIDENNEFGKKLYSFYRVV